MAEEPQPPENPPAQTATEQKQEAAALSNLSTQNISEEEDPTSAGGKASKADHAALGAALSHLSVGEGKKEGEAGKQAVEKKERKEVKRVTVDEGDVKFLIEELEVSKKKANEMLQSSGADRMAAVKTFVVPAVKA